MGIISGEFSATIESACLVFVLLIGLTQQVRSPLNTIPWRELFENDNRATLFFFDSIIQHGES